MESVGSKNLIDVYCRYIETVLSGDLSNMVEFVAEDVVHNDNKLDLEGYKSLLKRNIVDTKMSIQIKRLIADRDHVAAVLIFTTSEHTKELAGYKLDGRIFSFAENVVYDFDTSRRIKEVHSIIEIDIIRAHARC